MKKVTTLLAAALFVSTTMMADSTVDHKPEPKTDKNPEVRVTCGTTVNGIYVEVSAGWLFTSAETATERCIDKLADVVASMQ